MNTNFSIGETKQAIDHFMLNVLSRRVAEAQKISPRYGEFWQHITTVAMTGGKRFRPYLAIVGYGGLDQKILPIAAAQEFVHLAMLMHDDVIDQDFIRRGHKNINGIYRESYAHQLDNARATHYANSVGVLAGDTLLSEAYRVITTSDFNAVIQAKVTDALSRGIFEVIGGELLDIEAAFITETSYDPILIYRYKTASYSFIGPLLAGAYCRGSDAQTIKTLMNFASNLGIAFQIQDDLLGVFGDETETGKSTVTDLLEGKRTSLVAHHEQAMNPEMRTRFAAFGNPHATADELEAVKFDMIESGARDKTTALVDSYFHRAAQHLQKLSDEMQRTRLDDLMKKLKTRRR